MAFDILSVPSMSAELERSFSGSKDLITDDRNRLGEEIVNACQCLKQWQLVEIKGFDSLDKASDNEEAEVIEIDC
jgi:hypothetical protein